MILINNNKTKIQLWVLIVAPIIAFLLVSFNNGTEPRLNKKMDQVIKKVWKDTEVTKTPFLVPPNLKPGEATEIYSLSANNESIGYMILNKAYSCKVGGCSAWSPVQDQSNYEPYYYVVIMNTDLTINQIKIIEYYSEYGYEITSKRWLAQFMGKTGCNLEYEKHIDGFSGATISVKSMVYDINNTCKMMEQLNVMNLLGSNSTQQITTSSFSH